MRRHLRPGNGAAESFVSFIRLFDRALHPPTTTWAPADRVLGKIVRPIHAATTIYPTLEGVARRAS
jgi:hypothetical protein